MYKIYILVLLFGTTCCQFPLNLDAEYEDLELESETTDSFNITTSDVTIGRTNSNFTITSTEHNVLAMESHIKELSGIMKDTIHRIRQQFKKIDIVFLIDSSSSVGKSNFISELRFVVKFLSDFNVSFNYTRVGIVTFSSEDQIMRYVDHISEPDADNDKCKLLNFQMPSIEFSGGGTHTAGALLQAKSILSKARRHSKKIICLITDGFSNGLDPLPIANKLKEDNVTILSFGIQTGNFAELHKLSSEPNKEYSFLLNSFAQFESLARKALHTDYKIGNAVRIKNSTSCDTLCDKSQLNDTSSCCDSNAECTCSTISGHYSCMCTPGYYGSGAPNDCQLCPNGTYWHSWNLCKPCPDINHVTSHYPALNSSSCVCKSGFKSDERNRCEILRCPELQPPANGYFVKHSLACDRVLNTACGARCKSGYQLVGSSIRLCLENGTWSGVEAKCVLKTCPKLSIPYYGMATCKNSDLNIFYDYTPRNESFMKYYHDEELRTTELMPIDTDCKFKCGPGFYMIGSAMRNCLPLSKWDGLHTACKQIFCTGLPNVTFGQYDPTDCTSQKVVHGSNCTIVCDRGYEVRGPAVKTCGGKKSGIWSNRNKLPKCVDVTPPEMSCPDGFSVPMLDDENYALVKIFPAPNVTDNSDDNITYWLKPSVKDDGVKLTLGSHEFSYIAVDAFRNKAKCNFNITVLDITPPVIDNCIDPPAIFIPQHSNDNRSFVDWDHPIIYDNSGIDVNVTRTIEPGHLNVGRHIITYMASDSADNQNTCIMNVTVKALQCNTLSSPAHGQSLCAKNQTHTWCDVICDAGYTMYDPDESQHSDSIRLVCEDDRPQWKYEPLFDCTKIELPDTIEQIFSIALEDDKNVCDNNSSESESMIEGVLKQEIQQQLCQHSDDCEVLSEMPDCDAISKSRIPANASSNESNDRNYYSVVKRDVSHAQNNKSTVNMKIRVYVKISKSLGLWNQSLSRTDNLDIVKNELKTYHINERLRNQLDSLRINVKHLNLKENLLCRNGSVLKRSICVQCPKGTFHNRALNSCQMCKLGYYNGYESQTECQKCPEYQSTRKYGAKSFNECIAKCPPGTTARLRMRANRQLQNSLMPFCRKCPPTQYQPKFDQTECLNCPSKMTSPRGSITIDNCMAETQHICQMNVGICGPHGVCIPEHQNLHLYSCLCEEGFTGGHCEKLINLCASVPCHNGGKCSQTNSTTYVCQCSDRFAGDLCEIEKNSCSSDYCYNGGTCIETDRKPVCECSHGSVGEFCEIHQNYCSNNPCESGECSNNNDGFECKCPPGVIGKRCHLRPCDYLPCHTNAHCVNLPVLGATRRSYRCVCPKGLKGDACTQVKSACESNPCKNNAQCIPMALRMNGSSLESMNLDMDVDVYERYTCKCRPYFYGINCEIFVTPDYVLEFTKPGVHNYVKLNGPTENLNEITLCTWLQTNDSFNYGTIFSYATENIDNMFTLTDYNGIVLYVNGKNFITDITLNDGEWHFICVTWTSENGKFEIYIDGNLHDSGTNLSAGMPIEANGTIIVGQEQDSIGSSFSDSESFVGRIAYLDIWNRRVTSEEMFEYYTTCEPYQGNLFTWTDFRSQIHGTVKIVRSPFCKRCPQNLLLRNGFIRYLSNRAFHYCTNGYQMQGTSIRNCLRTSKWSLPIPYCRSVQCGHLSNILNGQITMEKTSSGEVAKYSCNENYNLIGSSTRTCQANGTWSGLQPECISKIKCSRLEAPNNAKLIYANEHGRVKDELANYPMGSFIEIQCLDGFTIKGESFLSCIETGTWDLPIPECIIIPPTTTTTTKKPTTIRSVTTTTTTAKTTTFTTLTTKKVTNVFRSSAGPSTKIEPKIVHAKPAHELPQRTIAIEENPNPPKVATTKIQTTIKHVQNDATTKVFKETTTERSPPLNEHVPDKVFWSKLKRLYYNGCNNNNDAQSELCVQLKNPFYYTDLALFDLPETNEFKHMDRRLLSLVKQADIILNTDSSIKLNVENLFPFILYQKVNIDDLHSRMSATTENAFRFILGLYIDTILLDKHLHSTNLKDMPLNDDSNITQQLKFFIIRLASKMHLDDATHKLFPAANAERAVYTSERLPDLANRNSRSALTPTTQASNTLSTVNVTPEIMEAAPTTSSPKISFQQSDESITARSSKTKQSVELSMEESSENSWSASKLRTDLFDIAEIPVPDVLESEPIEEMCRLETLPDLAPNSFITEIRIDNETLFHMPDRLYLIGPVAQRTRAFIACKDGFKQTSNEIIYFECGAKSIWLGKLIECEAIKCNQPSISNELVLNFRFSKNIYTFGQKLQLKCNEGYELKGEPFIQCLATGKWSRSTSNCSRISCQKPDLPSNAAIAGGSTYLYFDTLSIKCANNNSFEIQCNADGKWSNSPIDIC